MRSRDCCAPCGDAAAAVATLAALGARSRNAPLWATDLAGRPRALGHQRGTRRRRPSAGRGTPTQGEAVFAAKCQACHGEKGAGRPNDVLVGGFGTIASDQPAVKTVGSYWPYAITLFDYVRRAMPYQETKSLTNDELYAVSAYILHLNGIIGADDALDAQSLPKVKMPNRDGFILFPR